MNDNNIITETIAFKVPDSEIIDGDLSFSNSGEMRPLIIISHGYKGFKDWGFTPYIREQFALSGQAVIAINFSLNGRKSLSESKYDVDKFARNTVSREFSDLLSVIDRAAGGDFPESFNRIFNGDIYLLGFSLGGGISVLTAGADSRVKRLALWASVARFDRYSDRLKKLWHERGKHEFPSSSTGQTLRMNLEYLTDLEENNEKYSLPAILKRLNLPVMIAHGLQDKTVNPSEAKELAASVKPELLYEFYPEYTGHTFGTGEQFGKPTKALEAVLRRTIDFFL